MEYIFIDESGCMTKEHANNFPYFVMCLIHPFNKDKLKQIFKRYITSNFNRLKELDDGKMFKDGKFKELKGSSLKFIDKINLAYFLSKNNLFKIYYIVCENNKINNKLFENKARAFNYLLDSSLNYNFRNNNLSKDDYFFQIDERNIKNNSIKSLEDYLATELILKNDYVDSLSVEYFDSSNNVLIQIADFFSNLFYSYKLHPNVYKDLIDELIDIQVIKNIYSFPYK